MSVCAGMKPSQGLCIQGQKGQLKFLSFFRMVSAVCRKPEHSVALIFLIQNGSRRPLSFDWADSQDGHSPHDEQNSTEIAKTEGKKPTGALSILCIGHFRPLDALSQSSEPRQWRRTSEGPGNTGGYPQPFVAFEGFLENPHQHHFFRSDVVEWLLVKLFGKVTVDVWKLDTMVHAYQPNI